MDSINQGGIESGCLNFLCLEYVILNTLKRNPDLLNCILSVNEGGLKEKV